MKENEKAKQAEITEDCRNGCEGCGMDRKADCMPEDKR